MRVAKKEIEREERKKKLMKSIKINFNKNYLNVLPSSPPPPTHTGTKCLY